MNSKEMRTIHHLSCSGGTLISKCIAAMNNIALASEVHPYNIGKNRFNPLDPLHLLFSSNMLGYDKTILDEIFLSRISLSEKLCIRESKELVLRDHSHFDFLSKEIPTSESTSVRNILRKNYKLRSIITTRNPIDSFISMNRHGWNHGNLDFDAYCGRILIFLYAYRNIDVIRYEDFCKEPHAVLQRICLILNIDFNERFLSEFHTKIVTGDSGRGNALTSIEQLPPRSRSNEMQKAICESANYREVCRKLNYNVEHPLP